MKRFPENAFILCLLLVVVGCRPKIAKPLPKFADFPVVEIFHGTPAPLQITNSEERSASTDIRNELERKRTLDGSKLKIPNFAGHYVIIEGPNAPDYMQAIIVDLVTGRIFQPPFANKGGPHAGYFTIPMDPLDFEGIEFRVNSKLLILPRSSADPARSRGYSTFCFVRDHDRWISIN